MVINKRTLNGKCQHLWTTRAKGNIFAVVRNPLDCIQYINILKAASTVEDGPACWLKTYMAFISCNMENPSWTHGTYIFVKL